jgi:hypothetical protein
MTKDASFKFSVAPIFTPAALKLRHAPVADCARYDQLRRA